MSSLSFKKIAASPCLDVEIKVYESQMLAVQLAYNGTQGFRYATEGESTALLDQQILHWLTAYANKTPLTSLPPFTLKGLPPFSKNALLYLATLKFGQTLDYQGLATATGKPKAARAAGSACGRNPLPLFIPCHRILAKGGLLGGFSMGLGIKHELLKFEGISYQS